MGEGEREEYTNRRQTVNKALASPVSVTGEFTSQRRLYSLLKWCPHMSTGSSGELTQLSNRVECFPTHHPVVQSESLSP